MLPRSQHERTYPGGRPSATHRGVHLPNILHHKLPGKAAARPAITNNRRMNSTEKLISDCYSKRVIDQNGRPTVENSYQTHVRVREYSSYPSHPPPPHLPPDKIGSVKERVLVICVKYSNRVLLQKGKYNDSKDVYQIGRTWDMDELKTITKVGDSGVILSLNKDYYWEIEGDADTATKFIRFLTKTFSRFMGRYPKLNGYTLEQFRLPPIPEYPPSSIGGSNNMPEQQLKAQSNHRQMRMPSKTSLSNSPDSVPFNKMSSPSPKKEESDYYKHFDFTSNGKLPVKPMKVLAVDRSRSGRDNSTLSSRRSYEDNNLNNSKNSNILNPVALSSHQSEKDDISLSLDGKSNDTLSFVFKPSSNSYSTERLQEYSRNVEGGSSSPLRKYKPRNNSVSLERSASGKFESLAQLGLELEKQLEGLTSDNLLREANTGESAITGSSVLPQKGKITSPDFGIEEIQEYSDENEGRGEASNFVGLGIMDEEGGDNLESLNSNSNTIDKDHLTDVSSHDNTLLNFNPSVSGMDRIKISNGKNLAKENEPFFSAKDKTISLNTHEKGIASSESSQELENSFQDKGDTAHLVLDGVDSSPRPASQLSVKFQGFHKEDKDAELEEFLDDITWSLRDDSESLVTKIGRELDNLKLKKIEQLSTLDFSKDLDDVGKALEEADNLKDIFKRMELNFRLLEPEVHLIEADSRGIQVKYINKKLLFNDLSNILDEISLSKVDIQTIENFDEFDELDKLENIEEKIQRLYNALKIIMQSGTENDDGLSKFRALKQYQLEYERVCDAFIENFKHFLHSKIFALVSLFNQNIENFSSRMLLENLQSVLIYSGVMYFVKSISIDYFRQMNSEFDKVLSNFLHSFILKRISTIKHACSSTASAKLSQSLESGSHLKKSLTLRFSARKENIWSKLNNLSPSEQTNELPLENKDSSLIENPRLIMSLISETKELILVLQNFLQNFFHAGEQVLDYNNFCKRKTFDERKKTIGDLGHEQLSLAYSDEMMKDLNEIFGAYIKDFLKRVTPVELSIPSILCYLAGINKEMKGLNLEYLICNFINKVEDRFGSTWFKFIDNQVNSLDKSAIVAHCGVLPSIKNAGQVFVLTETSLNDTSGSFDDSNNQKVLRMVEDSYKTLNEAIIHLLLRDDPLLKTHDFDDKERGHRNVSVIQNAFYLIEQISLLKSKTIDSIKEPLNSVFKNASNSYFNKLLNKNVGKIVDFVNNYESLSNMKGERKYNKKYIKSVVSSYNHKDLSIKVQDMFKKLEKHFLVGVNVFEQDLLDRLWNDLEITFSDYLARLQKIIRTDFDRDIDLTLSQSEVHSIFKSIH